MTFDQGSTDFGVILGSFWGHFGITLGSFWDHFGIMLGSIWDQFGVMLGSFPAVRTGRSPERGGRQNGQTLARTAPARSAPDRKPDWRSRQIGRNARTARTPERQIDNSLPARTFSSRPKGTQNTTRMQPQATGKTPVSHHSEHNKICRPP